MSNSPLVQIYADAGFYKPVLEKAVEDLPFKSECTLDARDPAPNVAHCIGLHDYVRIALDSRILWLLVTSGAAIVAKKLLEKSVEDFYSWFKTRLTHSSDATTKTENPGDAIYDWLEKTMIAAAGTEHLGISEHWLRKEVVGVHFLVKPVICSQEAAIKIDLTINNRGKGAQPNPIHSDGERARLYLKPLRHIILPYIRHLSGLKRNMGMNCYQIDARVGPRTDNKWSLDIYHAQKLLRSADERTDFLNIADYRKPSLLEATLKEDGSLTQAKGERAESFRRFLRSQNHYLIDQDSCLHWIGCDKVSGKEASPVASFAKRGSYSKKCQWCFPETEIK